MVESVESAFRTKLADGIEAALEDTDRNFCEFIDEWKPELGFSENIDNPQLNALFNFADDFSDATYHGFEEVAPGVPIELARRILQICVIKLRLGESDFHPTVRKFEGKHHPNKFWGNQI